MNVDPTLSRFAGRKADFRRFNAVHHTIAQHMLESGGHPVQHTTVHFDVTASDVQPDLLAGLFRSLAHHPVKAFRNAFKLHHARAQEIALQFAGLAPHGCQAVFGNFHRTLQVALHRGHVVHRLGHHASNLLHPREAVELEWIENLIRFAGLGQTRLHLGFGLNLHVVELLTQSLQVPCELLERIAQRRGLAVHARACGDHLTGLADQTIQQLGTHPNSSAGPGRSQLRSRRKGQTIHPGFGYRNRGGCHSLVARINLRDVNRFFDHHGFITEIDLHRWFGLQILLWRNLHHPLRVGIHALEHFEARHNGVIGAKQGLH